MGSDKLKNKLIVKDRTLPSPYRQPEIKTKTSQDPVKIKSIVKCLEYVKSEITKPDQYNLDKQDGQKQTVDFAISYNPYLVVDKIWTFIFAEFKKYISSFAFLQSRRLRIMKKNKKADTLLAAVNTQ